MRDKKRLQRGTLISNASFEDDRKDDTDKKMEGISLKRKRNIQQLKKQVAGKEEMAAVEKATAETATVGKAAAGKAAAETTADEKAAVEKTAAEKLS